MIRCIQPGPGGLCFFHANPNKASELGRIGGRSKRHAATETAIPLPTLDTAIAVRDTLARLIPDVLSGKLHPKVAAGLAPLLSLQLRVIERTDMEQRIADLEKRLADVESKPSGSFDGDPDVARVGSENLAPPSDSS